MKKLKKLIVCLVVLMFSLSATSNAYTYSIRSKVNIKDKVTDMLGNVGNTNLCNEDRVTIKDMINFSKKIKEIYSNVSYDPQTITCSKELAKLCTLPSAVDDIGPIGVVPAVLKNEDGEYIDITLITLGGTEFQAGQATDVKTDILSGMELNNDYLKALVNLFSSVDSEGNAIIPKDKPIVVSGISLGGMVAQQLLAKDEVMDNYDIINIVCFGSPIICPNYRVESTTIRRLCDVKDTVPSLSVSVILDMDVAELDALERVDRDGGYKTTACHALSYVDAKCWNNFDVLGFENSDAEIELLETLTFYEAPLK